jgi:hypothetical protein
MAELSDVELVFERVNYIVTNLDARYKGKYLEPNRTVGVLEIPSNRSVFVSRRFSLIGSNRVTRMCQVGRNYTNKEMIKIKNYISILLATTGDHTQMAICARMLITN